MGHLDFLLGGAIIMTDPVVLLVISIVGIVVGIAVFLAQMRLFSIDRTLKCILSELESESKRQSDAEFKRRLAEGSS
jgi:hypothetical protein